MYFDGEGLFQITEEELVRVFSVAFARMLERDRILFEETNPQERAFMHRFAQELRRELSFAEDYRREGKPVLSLDVEYNRDGKERKTPEGTYDPREHRWIAPDIIFHERGSKEHEFRNDIFACEMKKDSSPNKADAERLKTEFLGKRKYRYGIDFYQCAQEPYEFNLYRQQGGCQSYFFNPAKKVFTVKTDR